MEQLKTKRQRKQQGIHYTPEPLAQFLAQQIWRSCQKSAGLENALQLRILDPACGDGRLLAALVSEIGPEFQLEVVGFETDQVAVERASENLSAFDNCSVSIRNQDFLSPEAIESQGTATHFDLVITNPPYVRTQQLGQQRSQVLARRFGLTGRVDLYHAFVALITQQLLPGGTLGLLTSNRFMYVQSGKAMRQMLSDNYRLKSIYDLGDSKFFEAAVLPVVVVGAKLDDDSEVNQSDGCRFKRVGEIQDFNDTELSETESLLGHIANENCRSSLVHWNGSDYSIEVGDLVVDEDVDSTWLLSSVESVKFLQSVASNQFCTFGDVAEIKVGIKTTADSVFIRDDWDQLPSEQQPERELLRPLITHHVAKPWRAADPVRLVLYPYESKEKRTTVDFDKYPRALRYLESNREKLSSRKYVTDSGRQWFEIWVPQQPADWAKPKIVWPDISETPRFFLDDSGAVVNGDCYWIKLRPDQDPDWMYLMLAIANSNVVLQYYDYRCQNRLYAGRRRFMTQYVKQFPLPNIDSKLARQVVQLTKQRLELAHGSEAAKLDDANLQGLVRKIFDC